jgi:hypothetical protein
MQTDNKVDDNEGGGARNDDINDDCNGAMDIEVNNDGEGAVLPHGCG